VGRFGRKARAVPAEPNQTRLADRALTPAEPSEYAPGSWMLGQPVQLSVPRKVTPTPHAPGSARLRREGITFKQGPYEIKLS